MKPSTAAIRFLETLLIPEGPKGGQPLRLAPFQKQFVRGALADAVNVAASPSGGAMPRPPCRLGWPWAR